MELGGRSESVRGSAGACREESLLGTQPPSTQVIPRVLAPAEGPLEPPLQAWGSPTPRTCWLRDPGVFGCWSPDLEPVTSPPCPEGRAPGGAMAPTRAVAGAGSVGLRAAGRGGRGRAGRGAPSRSRLLVLQPRDPEGGGRC